jgi:ankyrin repeat protein
MELGCDVNAQVVDKRTDYTESYRKWGIQHFLMRFPSLKLIKFFKNKIRDFNAENNNGMTPLHLFCKNITDGNLLNTKYIKISKEYEAENIIEYLLANGLNPNTTDSTKSLPILYATLNSQYKFIMILLKHKSEINQVNSKNQVPFIEIIKKHSHYCL